MREISIAARRKVWRHGIAAGALMALAATTAQAQQKQQAAADDALEEIVVTGSRIARPNLTQPTPVQVISSEAIQATGLNSTVDVLSQLPQTQNDMGPSTNARFINGAGVNFANLRGLGEYRTLTLVDGKRHVGSLSGRNGSGGTSLVDLNSIPTSLIERMEIVTGGTSAVYGADAVARVVNVILKRNTTAPKRRSSTTGRRATASSRPTSRHHRSQFRGRQRQHHLRLDYITIWACTAATGRKRCTITRWWPIRPARRAASASPRPCRRSSRPAAPRSFAPGWTPRTRSTATPSRPTARASSRSTAAR
ncbi:TonB-dependent siderophore receptor [Azospirillum sp. B4]|uniref:TonB-dependent receptor plug domain-containing protein n=1 Tax=Azospirillum sp. B4 TaxID=95605 RepID=UPI00034A56B6|nr:TonB-dependent receptor plug domain-containing protein [Azospirillum sp. B4]